MLLPKTLLTLPELRKKAKLAGFKIQARQWGYDGDPRISWVLISLATQQKFHRDRIFFGEIPEEAKRASEFINSVCINK